VLAFGLHRKCSHHARGAFMCVGCVTPHIVWGSTLMGFVASSHGAFDRLPGDTPSWSFFFSWHLIIWGGYLGGGVSLLFLMDGHGWWSYHGFGATCMPFWLMDHSLDIWMLAISCVIFVLEHPSHLAWWWCYINDVPGMQCSTWSSYVECVVRTYLIFK
jgi:hypothetical protein